MDENVMLRCKYCGAPFETDKLDTDSPYVTCTSCGTSQQRVDARAYLEQLMGTVQSWISSAIPTGFNMSQAENVDAVARHSIFVRSIQPKIENGFMEYKFCNNNILANCLLILPFMTVNIPIPQKTSAQAFEFNASVKSVSSLAVDDASVKLVNDAAMISQVYALIVNNTKLIAEDKEGRFILMTNNFTETARLVKDIEGYGPMYERFNALASIYTGISLLLEGDLVNSAPALKDGKVMLEKVQSEIMANPELNIMYQGVTQELSAANALLSLHEMIFNNPSMDPIKTIEIIHQIMNKKITKSGNWTTILGNMYRYTEIFNELANVFTAKSGESTLRVASGGGQYLMPFWKIDLEYSVVGGGLFSKKSVEIDETLLVPADFVCYDNFVRDPTSAITDTFSLREGKKDNDSISEREGLKSYINTVQNSSANARQVMLPLSTKKEASKLVNEYLSYCRSKNKIELCSPRVRELMYIPCDITNGLIKMPKEFGKLVPKQIKNTNDSNILYI